MTIQHVDIADPNIHEPKGVASASVNTVYVADGAGTGAWQKVDFDAMDTTDLYTDIQADLDDGSLEVTGRFFVTTVIDDISTADEVLVPLIRDCTVIGASMVLEGAITSADADITFKNSAGATMGTAVTIAYDGSAAGDQYSFTASGNNTITGPDYIEIETDGASDTAQRLFITVELEYTVND